MRSALLATTMLAVASSAHAAANFTVSANGGFTDPNGQAWSMRGLNAGVQDALQGFPNVMQQFPGMTAIRLNTGGNDDPAAINQVVQEYTGKGVVVEIEDHSGNANNVAWYQQMASTYKNNPLVMLETPNEPNPNGLAQTQIGIIQAIRATGFANPIGVQPGGGFDQSNIPAVVAALGTNQLFVTPHIYIGGNTDPNAAANYVQSEISAAKSNGLFASIDEFGNAMDGFTMDPMGNTVIDAVTAANQAGQAGAIAWAMDNGNHPDGANSACLNTGCTQLTPMGQALQSWLSGHGSASDLASLATNATPASFVDTVASAAGTASKPITAPDQQAGGQPTVADLTPPAPAEASSSPPDTGPPPTDDLSMAAPPQPAPLSQNAPQGTSPPLQSPPMTGSLSATGFTALSGADGSNTISVTNKGNVVSETGGQQFVAINGDYNAIELGPYDDFVEITGAGNTINAGGGVNVIDIVSSDPVSPAVVQVSSASNQKVSSTAAAQDIGNVIILPAPGTGEDIIRGKLGKLDRIDLTQALATTTWDHTAATMLQFFTIQSGVDGGTIISVGGKVVGYLASPVKGDISTYLVAQ